MGKVRGRVVVWVRIWVVMVVVRVMVVRVRLGLLLGFC